MIRNWHDEDDAHGHVMYRWAVQEHVLCDSLDCRAAQSEQVFDLGAGFGSWITSLARCYGRVWGRALPSSTPAVWWTSHTLDMVEILYYEHEAQLRAASKGGTVYTNYKLPKFGENVESRDSLQEIINSTNEVFTTEDVVYMQTGIEEARRE